jgi:hypothetical protein
MNLSSAVNAAKTVITANSPVLLVGTAIAGVVTTGVLAARAGYKARGIVDTAEAEKGSDLTPKEKISATWLCYAIPAATGVSTIGAIAGVHTIHTKRHAALAGLYAVTSTKLDDYREKAEEMLGAKKSQELNDAVGQAAVDRHPLDDDKQIVILEGGTELMFDDWSGRYFMGSVPIVEAAVAEVNLKLVAEGDASLNDFYEQVGLSPLPMGIDFGWSGKKIDVSFGAVKTKDGRAAVSYWFPTKSKPKQSLDRS